MDMEKKSPEAISESKVNKKLIVLGLALAFATGAFVKGEVQKHEDKIASTPEVCKVTIQENGSNTVISTQGSTAACTPFINALRGRIDDEDAPEGEDGQATDDDQAAQCDPASASEGDSK